MKYQKSFSIVLLLLMSLLFPQGLTGETRGVENGERYDKLVIRNVVVIDGNGTPPHGPVDITLSGNTIQSVAYPAKRGRDDYRDADHVLDGTGMYVLPGLINLHGHYSKVGVVPFEYIHKLYLACGVTSLRDVGSDYDKTIPERSKIQKGEVAAPRLFLYMREQPSPGRTPEQARERIRGIKEAGGDGVKISGLRDKDVFYALMDEAKKLELRVAHDHKVNETDAWDDAATGMTTIEHWYGIPDAALRGSQNFPYWYNYNNENERFRYAGHLWREADPDKLEKVLQALVEAGVAWDTTFSVYEANRDLMRARNKAWYKDYLHPDLEEWWKPNPAHHASYFWEWTTEDEAFWREDYMLWMKASRAFADMGGMICVGDDAGSLYTLYGFGLIRELELQWEAGFHPIDIIMHATGNNAKALGMEDKLGRVREGFLADLLIMDRNPLKNFKYFYPTGVLELKDGKLVKAGGVNWTIKDGIVYHTPTMMADVKAIVEKAKEKR
jgi:hypothetical protein